MDYFSGEWAACLFKWATRELHVVLLLHSANVRVNEVRLFPFLGDAEIGSSGGDPKLQVSQERKQQKAFVCLCRRSHLVILGEWLGNTGLAP